MRSLLTLANVLTLCRLLLCFPIFFLLWSGANRWLTLAVFGVAALTDTFDGYFARARNEISTLGKLLDPVADKLLVVGTLLAFAVRGTIPTWWLVVLALKEAALLMGGLVLLGTSRRVVASRMPGKAATTVLLAGIAAVLVGWEALGRPLLGAGILLSVGAGVDYLLLLLRRQA